MLTVHTSSKTVEWETPQWLFNQLDKEFHFNTDVCATPDKAKCPHFFSPTEDGLRQTWVDQCWMNPPYGRPIGKWMQKAYESAASGNATVVCLVPARTDTRWWHEYCSQAEVRFIKGRVKFGTAKAGAPFPSAIVIFKVGKDAKSTTTYCTYRQEAARTTSPLSLLPSISRHLRLGK